MIHCRVSPFAGLAEFLMITLFRGRRTNRMSCCLSVPPGVWCYVAGPFAASFAAWASGATRLPVTGGRARGWRGSRQGGFV